MLVVLTMKTSYEGRKSVLIELKPEEAISDLMFPVLRVRWASSPMCEGFPKQSRVVRYADDNRCDTMVDSTINPLTIYFQQFIKDDWMVAWENQE